MLFHHLRNIVDGENETFCVKKNLFQNIFDKKKYTLSSLYFRKSAANHVFPLVTIRKSPNNKSISTQFERTNRIRPHKETSRIQSHLKFRTGSNKHGTNRFVNTIKDKMVFNNSPFLQTLKINRSCDYNNSQNLHHQTQFCANIPDNWHYF